MALKETNDAENVLSRTYKHRHQHPLSDSAVRCLCNHSLYWTMVLKSFMSLVQAIRKENVELKQDLEGLKKKEEERVSCHNLLIF